MESNISDCYVNLLDLYFLQLVPNILLADCLVLMTALQENCNVDGVIII
jgi:hypothetical protein